MNGEREEEETKERGTRKVKKKRKVENGTDV